MDEHAPEQTAQELAKTLPPEVVYHAVIRAWAFATSGQYGDTVVTEITADEVLYRWERGHNLRPHPARMMVDTK